MQISALRKLLQLISPSDSPEELKLSEEISEQEETETEAEEIRNDEDKEAVCDEPADEVKPAPVDSNRSHLTSSVPRAAKAPLGTLTKGELAEIRAIFNNMDDLEIQRLYKKVNS